MSLINEALKRADAEKGPHQAQPLPPPPPLPPQPSSASSSARAAALGGALLVMLVAGALAWKMFFDETPVQVVASPAVPPAESRAAGAKATPAASQAAPAPAGRAAASERSGGPPAGRPAPAPQERPLAADPLLAAAAALDSMKDVFGSQPTLFLDQRAPQASDDDPLLAPPAARPAALEPLAPARLASAFTAPAGVASAAPQRTAPAAPPAAAPAAEPPKLKVTSIFYNARSPTAIINGQVIGVGEFIDGVKIEAITPRTVEVSFDGRRLTLRL
jgi:hypothetical protein